MNVRNDRVAGPAPGGRPATPTPDGATGSSTGTTGSTSAGGAGGVQELEELAQQSLVDGQSVAPPLPPPVRHAAPQRASAPPMTARTRDASAVEAVLEAALGRLKRGESVKIGGKAEGGEGLLVQGGAELEVERLEDGRYEVRMSRDAGIGFGEKLGAEENDSKLALMATASQEVSFQVDTMGEAESLTARVLGLAVTGASLPLVPGAGELGLELGVALERDKVSCLRQALGGELGADLEVVLDEELKLGAHGSLAAELALAFEPPDRCFLEWKGELDSSFDLGEEGAKLEISQAGLEAERHATVRVPLEGLADPGALLSEEGRGRLLDAVKRNLKNATVTVEVEDTLAGALGGMARHAEKTVKASELRALADDSGWEMKALIKVGPKINATIGPGELEIGVQRTAVVFEHRGGSLAEERALVESRQRELESQALREHPGWAKVQKS